MRRIHFIIYISAILVDWNGGGVKNCSCIAALASSQRLAPNSLVPIFPAESADGLCTESEAAGARTEDPKEQRLKSPHHVATSLKPTSCWPPRKASAAMEINIYIDLQYKSTE